MNTEQQNTKNKYLIKKVQVINPGEILPETDILIEDGIIREIGKNIKDANFPVLDASGKKVIPGLIDVHIQGAGGSDFLDRKEESLNQISRTLASFGTTCFLATTVFFTREKDNLHLELLANVKNRNLPGAKIAGVHLEGPYISIDKKGMIQPQCICSPEDVPLESIMEKCGDSLRMMTIAPELPGVPEIISSLLEKNVIPSIGHTNATFDEANQAIEKGVRHVTHLFNAMKSFHHREPGALGAILMDDRPVCQIIPDGNHIHPAVIKWIFTIKEIEKFALITDGMSALGSTGEKFYYNDNIEYHIRNGAAFYKNGTLIGTVLPQIKLLDRLHVFTGIPIEKLLACATTVPAEVLGISDKKGSIEVGKDADIVVIDNDWTVEKTFIEGNLVFERNK